MSMTPSKRRQCRAKYESQSKARKDVRLGLTKKAMAKKGKKR